ncbi:WD repeat domain-containing protein [Xylariaceae sp. FL0594]|nr:WD repeat domain-containing protein [Xylariaceae sp. FL0594]
MASMIEFRTPGFNPYAVKYSPYYDNRIAVASAANYGIVGNGRLFCLALGPGGVQIMKTFDTNDAQYDLAWSEINENQLLTACGDGSVKLYDVNVNDFPIMNFHEHKREVYSVAWSPVTKDTFLSSSWDGTVKLWSPARQESLRTLPIGNCTYSASYCPTNPSIVSAVSSDSHLRIYDLRKPVDATYGRADIIQVHKPPPPSHTPLPPGVHPPAMPAEVLTHDWNKYRDTVIATGGVDRVVRTFDIRNPSSGPLSILMGHEYAVRRLAWSPHAADVLLSAGYDMTVRLWTDGSTLQQAAPAPAVRPGVQLGIMNRHTEFVTGLDWCLFGVGGWVATVGWDERMLLWDANAMLQQPRR